MSQLYSFTPGGLSFLFTLYFQAMSTTFPSQVGSELDQTEMSTLCQSFL